MSNYAEVPYPSRPQLETQPSLLLALGRLHGVSTASPDACRTLELGCGDGGNLLAAACLHPESSFLGIDLDEHHIEAGRAQAEALKLTNIRFEVGDIAKLEPGFETFDCIICHGVFSWVPRFVQEALLALYRSCLAPAGVGTLGLKTYPGWHRLSLTRDIVQFAGRQRGGSAPEQLSAGIEMLDFLVERTPKDGLYNATLRALQAGLEGRRLPYLVHEYLEADNDPIRYTELVERVTEHELRIVCNARYAEDVAENYVPPAGRARFAELAGDDPVARSQLLDLFVQRSFRRPLIVRAETEVGPPSAEALHAMCAFTAMQKEDDRDPVVVAIREASPSGIGFDALASATGLAPEALGEKLLAAHRRGSVELLLHDLRCAEEPGERPRAYPYARLCATRMSGPVVNLRQEMIDLDPFAMIVLTRIDGERDRAGVVDQLVGLVRDGVLGITAPDGSPLDDETLRATLGPALEKALQLLTLAGMLLPATDAAASVD